MFARLPHCPQKGPSPPFQPFSAPFLWPFRRSLPFLGLRRRMPRSAPASARCLDLETKGKVSSTRPLRPEDLNQALVGLPSVGFWPSVCQFACWLLCILVAWYCVVLVLVLAYFSLFCSVQFLCLLNSPFSSDPSLVFRGGCHVQTLWPRLHRSQEECLGVICI